MARKQEDTKVRVTKRALIQRVNRKLQKKNAVIKRARNKEATDRLGEFYEVNLKTESVSQTHVDLEVLASQLDILRGWETLDRGEK